MRALLSLAVVHLCLHSAFAGETCRSIIESVETACEYSNKLVLISSPNGKQVDSDNCDAEYQKSDWQEEPTIKFPNADPEKTYTLINIDPDPPAYENGQYYLHWLVSHIKGEDFAKGDLTKANHLQGYYGPAPPEGSGVHRYMFLAFEEGKNGAEVHNPARRSKFALSSWLRQQQSLCGPVAGIQFRTSY